MIFDMALKKDRQFWNEEIETLPLKEMKTLQWQRLKKQLQYNYDKSEYLKKELKKAGFEIPFESGTFNEFVVAFPQGFDANYERLLEKKIIAGLPLERFYPEFSDHYLLCVTETRNRGEIDALVKEVAS